MNDHNESFKKTPYTVDAGEDAASLLLESIYNNGHDFAIGFAAQIARTAVSNNVGEFQRKLYEIAYAITEAVQWEAEHGYEV
ncbi:MAG: hypothetical protein GF411_02810 [Candidatus Lokiarchaeota archaeon]|nr:hypothetical protein [Candidatus Lokiarchaeota archaeon]